MKLHVETLGSGPDLVMVHGWGMNAGVWLAVARTLARDFRLRLVELPGHGMSPYTDAADGQAWTEAVAECLPAGARVLGWSLGSQLVLQIALRAPEQIARLVLVSATPRFVTGDDWPAGVDPKVLDDFAASLEADYEGTLKRFLALQVRGTPAQRESLAALRSDLFARGRPAAGALRAGLRMLKETDLRPVVADIRQPALLIHGEHDALVPPDAGAWLATHLAQARLLRIEHAGHAPFLSHPVAFAKAVREFLLDA